jgi:hypothetical protein
MSGCGTSATAGAAPTASTKAQAASYAAAVNLRAADVPGMISTAPEREAPPLTPEDRENERCAGNVDPSLIVAKILSGKFAGEGGTEHEQVQSTVEVMTSATVAARNHAANWGRRAFSCAERLFPKALARSNGGRVRYGHLKITRLPNPLAGVPGSVGVRIAVPILGVPAAIEPNQPYLYIDSLSFLSGPAEIALVTSAFPRPADSAAETRLVSILHSRADAHKL